MLEISVLCGRVLPKIAPVYRRAEDKETADTNLNKRGKERTVALVEKKKSEIKKERKNVRKKRNLKKRDREIFSASQIKQL